MRESEFERESYGHPKLTRLIHKGVRKFGHTLVCHSTRDFTVPKHNVRFRTVPKPHETGL